MMNLDIYLEKDVLRRIKFVEYLYLSGPCDPQALTEDLQISLQTLKNDFTRIQNELEAYIDKADFEKQSVAMTFKHHVPLPQLTREIYKNSKFTRVLYRVLNGDDDNASISQQEFISTSNVYKIMNNINILYSELDLYHHELRYRLLMNDLFTKIDFVDEYIIEEIWEDARQILDHLIDEKTVYIHPFNYDIIVMNIYLSLLRAIDHPLTFDIEMFRFLDNNLIYQDLCEYYRRYHDTPYYRQEAAITTIIYLQNINYKDYVLAQTFQQQHWSELTHYHTSLYYLYLQLMSLKQRPIIDELSIQRTFERLMFNSWVGIPAFTPHYHIAADDHQYTRFRQIFIRWNHEQYDQSILLQDSNLKELYHLFSHTMLSHSNYYTCNIVTTSQDRFTLFFNFFYKYLSSSQFKINSTMFYSMDELPNELFQYPYIIICDRELEDLRFRFAENIFPFSPNTLRHDTRHLLNHLIDDTINHNDDTPPIDGLL